MNFKQTQWGIREPPSVSMRKSRSSVQKIISTPSTILEVMCFFPRDICTIQVIRSYHSCHQIICIIQVIRSYASFKSWDHMHHSSHEIICIIQVWLNTPTINRVKTYTSLQHDIRSYVLVHYSTKKYDLAQSRPCASKSYEKYISTTLIKVHVFVKSSWMSRTNA